MEGSTVPVPASPQGIRKNRTSRQSRRQARAGVFFLLPFVALFVLVFIGPIIISVRAAFFKQIVSGGGLYGGGETIEQFVGFQNFAHTLTSEAFWTGMGRVLLFGVFQIPIMIFGALALALILDSWLVKRVAFFRLAFFLPYAIPGLVAAVIWLYLYSPSLSPLVKALGAIGLDVDFMSKNVILASMANMTTWTFTGYNMLIFLAALQAIPLDLYEAARIDGATGFQIVTRIKIPLVRNAALLAVLLSIIGTVQLFNEPTVMATANTWMGKDFTPMMMSYAQMMGGLSPAGDGPASATALVMALIAGALAIIYAMAQSRNAD